jgi:outer membrane protein OmpA-like peptidoglycan-associated protein
MTTRGIAILLAARAAGCAPARGAIATPQPRDLVVLLPEPDGSASGEARVSNAAGRVDLLRPLDATETASGLAPSPPAPMNPARVDTIFGDALGALPLAPEVFVLRFEFDSDRLTAESRATLPRILASVAAHPAPDVVVIGHTDRVGDDESNVALGLKRASTVRDLLVAAGFDPSYLETSSHGESDPLVPTGDNVAEPMNRRVEITVR